jgi:hypothetical protein
MIAQHHPIPNYQGISLRSNLAMPSPLRQKGVQLIKPDGGTGSLSSTSPIKQSPALMTAPLPTPFSPAMAPAPKTSLIAHYVPKAAIAAHVLTTRAFIQDLGGMLKERHLKKTWKPSLDALDEAALGVQRTSLDLSSDACEFVRPIPLDVMTSWLEEKKPWVDRGFGSGWDKDLNAWWNSNTLGCQLRGWASSTYTCSGSPDVLGIKEDKTNWIIARYIKCMSSRTTKVSFDIDWRLESKDKSFPHLQAFLCQDTLLNEGGINAIELLCIAQLTYMRFMDWVYHSHRIVPVSQGL